MASTFKSPSCTSGTRASQPDLSHRRAQHSASQLTAELKAAKGKTMMALDPSRTSSGIESMASSRAARLVSSTWPSHSSSSQFKQRNPHATHQPTPTNSIHYDNNNNNTTRNLDSVEPCSRASALDNEIRRSYNDDQTLRASALWERYKTANTAPYRQTFSREPQDDEFWKQVSSSYQVW